MVSPERFNLKSVLPGEQTRSLEYIVDVDSFSGVSAKKVIDHSRACVAEAVGAAPNGTRVNLLSRQKFCCTMYFCVSANFFHLFMFQTLFSRLEALR